MKKNKIYQQENDENSNQNLNVNNNDELSIESNNVEEKIKNLDLKKSKDITNNNESNVLTFVFDYWNTFRKNETVSTIINPYQDDGECVNKVYKIYSYITITLILIVILLSITLS